MIFLYIPLFSTTRECKPKCVQREHNSDKAGCDISTQASKKPLTKAQPKHLHGQMICSEPCLFTALISCHIPVDS